MSELDNLHREIAGLKRMLEEDRDRDIERDEMRQLGHHIVVVDEATGATNLPCFCLHGQAKEDALRRQRRRETEFQTAFRVASTST